MRLKTPKPTFTANTAQNLKLLTDYVDNLRDEIDFELKNLSNKISVLRSPAVGEEEQ